MQLMQSARMASIGELSAGVAHEINNPISFVISNIHVLKKYFLTIKEFFPQLNAADNKNIAAILTDSENILVESLEGLERISAIVADLKAFSHADQGIVENVDINRCIESSLKIIKNELKYKCTLKKNYAELPLLAGLPLQLNQVFLNILVNATQAIPEQGEITITTSCVEEKIIIAIRDTGVGIPVENLNKLFSPFFTTKPVGQGTGLGLSVSYGIVKKHGGHIEVKSTVGEGTTFIIYLPRNGMQKQG